MSQSGISNLTNAVPSLPINFVADSGTAIAAANTINVLGGTNVTTSALGSTITIDASGGSVPEGALGTVFQGQGIGTPSAYSTATYPSTATSTGTLLRADGTNWTITTSTYPATNAVSTLLYASASNVMSALATANNGTLVTSNTGVPSILAGPGTTGNILQSNAAAAPSFSTATYPSTAAGTGTILRANGTNWVATTATYPTTTTANQILFSSAANTISEVTAGANGVLITSAGNVPSISSTLPAAVQGNITSTGTVASGIWNGTAVDVAHGGTGNTTFTAYSVICAGTTATGVFQNVSGVGTANQVLTSNGASALPTWQTPASGAGNWIKINSATASNSTSITFTGLSSTYGSYVVVMSNVAPVTDATTLWMRTSSNAGVSYDSGASDYSWGVDSIELDTSPTSSITADDADSQIEITGTDTMGNTTNENGAFWLVIYDPSAAQHCRVTWSGQFRGATPTDNMIWGAGARLAVADVDAIQFLMSSGNISTGEFVLYGLTA